jgi:hypothetical protein
VPEGWQTVPSARGDDREQPIMAENEPTLDEVKALIARLPRKDREMLRPWLLAVYDVRGYRLDRGVVVPEPESAPTS